MERALIAMEAFLKRALTDPQLRATLRECRSTEEFAAAALPHVGSIVNPGGFVVRLMSAASGGAGLHVESLPEAFGWLPDRIEWREGKPLVHWTWLGRRTLIEPFFSDSIGAARREPYG